MASTQTTCRGPYVPVSGRGTGAASRRGWRGDGGPGARAGQRAKGGPPEGRGASEHRGLPEGASCGASARSWRAGTLHCEPQGGPRPRGHELTAQRVTGREGMALSGKAAVKTRKPTGALRSPQVLCGQQP